MPCTVNIWSDRHDSKNMWRKMVQDFAKKMLVCALLFQVAFCSLLVAKADAVTPTDLEMVSRVTGVKPAGETMPNPNQTDTNYQISGTDLGIVWDKGGGQYFVLFGDTNGLGPNDWRSNTRYFIGYEFI